jgi:hypothetical protein
MTLIVHVEPALVSMVSEALEPGLIGEVNATTETPSDSFAAGATGWGTGVVCELLFLNGEACLPPDRSVIST